jgi:exo-1,4-beta-D-glucosaminidase
LHIQLGLLEPTVTVVNHTDKAGWGLVAKARVLDLSMKVLLEKHQQFDAAPDAYTDVFELPKLPNLPAVYFVRLDLEDARGQGISENLYWLPSEKGNPMLELHSLPLAAVSLHQSVEEKMDSTLIHATVENVSDQIAFFLQLAAVDAGTGDEFLPVLWSDNYVSLLPGERRAFTAEIATAALGGAHPQVVVGGWNIQTAFRCTALSAPESAAVESPFVVQAEISDTFIDGSRVDLFVDGKKHASQYHAVPKGKTATAHFFIQLPPGSHLIRVADREARVSVR